MSEERYPKEPYDESDDYSSESELPTDDGTMQSNVDALAEKVVGHRIVRAGVEFVPPKYNWSDSSRALVLTLDNGHKVQLHDTDDCCAYTELRAFLLNVEKIDHIITGVGTTDGFTKWHIYADFGDVVELTVGWSCGNPFYYGYGFDIEVLPL